MSIVYYTAKTQPKIPHKNHNTDNIESPGSSLQGVLLRVNKPASYPFSPAAIAGNRAGDKSHYESTSI